MKTLERLHPLCCFAYILAAAGITIFTRNPILTAESALGAELLLAVSGKAAALWLLPISVITSALLNPLFSHNGVTVLFFAGNTAFTLEAIVYGAVFGAMLFAVCAYGICGTLYLTSDKYIWLFGKILPAGGLVLSVALRLVPLFIRRTKSFAAAQGAESVSQHLKAFSASVGYSAEEAMYSADSMKARGYGCTRRTSYSLYRFGASEGLILAAIMLLFAAAVTLMTLGGGEFFFYPAMSDFGADFTDILLYSVFGALCVLPTAAVLREHSVRIKRR